MSAWQLKAASPPPRSRARRKTCYERRAWRRQIRPRSSPSVPAAGSRPRITQPAAVPTSAHATVDMASSRYHQTRGPARPKGSAPSHLCSGALRGAREEEIAARSQHSRLFSVFCACSEFGFRHPKNGLAEYAVSSLSCTPVYPAHMYFARTDSTRTCSC